MKNSLILCFVLIVYVHSNSVFAALENTVENQQCDDVRALQSMGQGSQLDIAKRNARLKLRSKIRDRGFKQSDFKERNSQETGFATTELDGGAIITLDCKEKWWWHCTAQATFCAEPADALQGDQQLE